MQKIVNFFFKNPGFFLTFRNKLQNNLISEKNVIKKYIKPNKNLKVLDFGCGTGDFCSLFNKSQYTGVDVEERFIKFNKSRFNGYNFIKVEEDKPLPFKDLYFDKILVFGVLHHINEDNVKKIMMDLSRVLSDSGQVLLYDQLPPKEQKNFIAKVLAKFDRGEFLRGNSKLKILLKKYFKIKENYMIRSGPYTLCVFILEKSR
tara:strand:- start:25588 stop:26196 length:609 start_codon:yes stop_codon:yes gene_type:complete